MFKRILLLASLLFFVSTISQGATVLKAYMKSFQTSSNCTYQTFNFQDSSSYTGGSNKGYNRVKWYYSDGGKDTGASVLKTFATTGTFTVSMVVSNSKDNLKDSIAKTVTISLKGVNSTFTVTGRPCQRVEFKINNTSIIPAPYTSNNITWSWAYGDGSTTSTYQPGIYVYPNSGTYTMSLKSTAPNGCVSTASQVMKINITPTAKATHKQHCVDSAATFDASSTVENGLSVAYTWTFPDTVENGKTASRVLHVSKTYQVILAVINKTNGCNDTLKVPFTVYSKPIVRFGYKPVCQDSIANFFDSTTVPYNVNSGIASWHWTFSDSLSHNYGTPFDATSDTIQVTHGFPHGGTFNVNLTVVTGAGCVDSATQQVYINPTPTPRFFFKNTCQDSAIQFSDSSVVPKGNKIVGWKWYFGDSNSQHKPYISTRQNPKHQYAKPGYAYKVKLIVTTSSGCKDSIVQKVKAYPSPTSAFATTTKCARDNVNFLNGSSTPITAVKDSIVKYKWLFGDGNTDSATNPSHAFRDSGHYQTKLVAYSAYGCTDTAKAIVQVYALPLPSFKLQGNCERDSVQFVNTSTTAYGKLVDSSYTWDFGDTVINNNIINPNHLFKYAGTFNVKLTAVAKGAGCTKDTIIPVTIIPGPHSDFSFVASCYKQPITFTNLTKSNNIGTIKSFWDFGDGTTDTSKNPTHTYATIKNYHVKLVSTMPATGCNDSVIHFVSVAPIPVALFKARSTCNDSAVTFKDSSSLATNYYFKSFDFDFGDGTIGKGPKTTHKYANPGTYTVKEVVTGTTGCKDSTYKTIRTYKIPTAKFGSKLTCAGIPTLFIDSTSKSDSVILWKWLFNGTDSIFIQLKDTIHNPSHTFYNADIPTAQLKVSTQYGCSNVLAKNVTPIYEPEPTFISPYGCNARNLQFFGSYTNKGTVTVSSYAWNFGDGKTSSDQITSHKFDSAGTYKVALIEVSSQGCTNTDTQLVTVTRLPIPGFYYVGSCFGEKYNFLDTSHYANQDLRYWDLGDGSPSQNVVNPQHTYAAPGVYTVKEYIKVAIGSDLNACISDTAKNYKVVVNPTPIAKFGWDTACFGSPTAFHDQSDALGGRIQKYLWTFRKGAISSADSKDSVMNPFFTFPDSFKGSKSDTFPVTLKITTNFGCVNTVKEEVTVKQRPKARFGVSPDPISIQHPAVTFTNNSVNANLKYYYWTFGDGFDSHDINPIHSYNDTGTYIVSLAAMSSQGCVDTFRYTLYVTPGYSLYAPNAITVNGDGINDEWKVKGVGVIDYDVIIVDIWGQEVFHSTDMNQAWKGDYNGNGIKVPEGMYVYYVKAGNFANTDFTKLKGNITVIR